LDFPSRIRNTYDLPRYGEIDFIAVQMVLLRIGFEEERLPDPVLIVNQYAGIAHFNGEFKGVFFGEFKVTVAEEQLGITALSLVIGVDGNGSESAVEGSIRSYFCMREVGEFQLEIDPLLVKAYLKVGKIKNAWLGLWVLRICVIAVPFIVSFRIDNLE
jgi:hypothetical protein